MSRTDRHRRHAMYIAWLGLLCSTAAFAGGPSEQTATPEASVAPKQADSAIRFYEGNDASQDNFCTIFIGTEPFSEDVHMKKGDKSCTNDEARSLKLEYIAPGAVIKLYDDPQCGDHDDWLEIHILKRLPRIIVGRFSLNWVGYVNDPPRGGDREYDSAKDINADWYQRYHPHNSIEGKISCATIRIPASP